MTDTVSSEVLAGLAEGGAGGAGAFRLERGGFLGIAVAPPTAPAGSGCLVAGATPTAPGGGAAAAAPLCECERGSVAAAAAGGGAIEADTLRDIEELPECEEEIFPYVAPS